MPIRFAGDILDAGVGEEVSHGALARTSSTAVAAAAQPAVHRCCRRSDGVLHFLPGPNGEGTLLRVTLRYKPPGGAIGAAATALFGGPGAQQLKQDLRRFKQVLETGEVITTEGQSHGPARASATRAASRS